MFVIIFFQNASSVTNEEFYKRMFSVGCQEIEYRLIIMMIMIFMMILTKLCSECMILLMMERCWMLPADWLTLSSSATELEM